MRRVSLISCLILMLFLISNATAEKTLKTVEMPLDYIGQTSAGETYIKTITVKPPDGIEKIISFEIKVRGDFKEDTGISAIIRKTGSDNIFSCEPEKWTIPKIDVADYWLSFDCSTLADKYNFQTGKIDVGIKMDRIAQNIKGYAVMTYYNEPKPFINLKGTEYEIGDIGKVFLQLLDTDYNPISNSTCKISVYNPDNTKLVDEATMNNLGENGLYYYNVNTPDVEGVYMISSSCYLPSLSIVDVADDDFESGGFSGGNGNWTSNWVNDGDGTAFISTESYNGTYALEITGDGGTLGDEFPDVNREFYSGCNYEMMISFYQKLDGLESGESCEASMTDANGTLFSLELWENGDDDDIWRNWVYTLNVDDYEINGNQTVRFNCTSDHSSDELIIDDLDITCQQKVNKTKYQEVKGSGEMHISDKEFKLNKSISEIPKKVWDYHNRTLTDYNQTEILNYLDYIISNQSQQNIYLAEINSTLYDLNNLSAEDVWSFYNRTLTDYNQTVLYDLLVYINSSQEQQYIALLDAIKSVNQTLYNEIASIRSQLHSVNNSLHTAIDGLNQSIHNDILSVLGELQTIQDNLTTIYDQMGIINSTIMNKLHSIQDEITSVNNTITNTNISIHNRIDELSEELEGYLLNITNATVNITLNQDEIISTFLAFYDEEENEYAYSSFSAIPIFGLSSFNGKQYKCVDNKTLVSIEERNITGDIDKKYTIVERKECTYGCMGNTCVAPNYMIWLSAIIIILFMFGLYEYLKSKGYI